MTLNKYTPRSNDDGAPHPRTGERAMNESAITLDEWKRRAHDAERDYADAHQEVIGLRRTIDDISPFKPTGSGSDYYSRRIEQLWEQLSKVYGDAAALSAAYRAEYAARNEWANQSVLNANKMSAARATHDEDMAVIATLERERDELETKVDKLTMMNAAAGVRPCMSCGNAPQ